MLKRFESVGSQEDDKDPIVIAKFFNPTGAGTWLATEYDPNSKESFNFGLLAAKRFENGGTEAKKVIFKTIGSYPKLKDKKTAVQSQISVFHLQRGYKKDKGEN